MVHQQQLKFSTSGRGTYNISDQINQEIGRSGIHVGTCQIFVHHTSASLILCENADPTVREDLESFISRLVPDGDKIFNHKDEGPDDMPAHLKSLCIGSSVSLPITDGQFNLGIWQGIYLGEHRNHAGGRYVVATLNGSPFN